VSALTSKFHRSQSSQSVVGQTGQIGGVNRTKGRYQFGNQSSSSTSTTTSSIPSTPSVDRDVLQPTAEGQESATDYDDDWDNEDWGAIDGDSQGTKTSTVKGSGDNYSIVTSLGAVSVSATAKASSGNDGWDTWPIEEIVSLPSGRFLGKWK
jgi:hypothetical protein